MGNNSDIAAMFGAKDVITFLGLPACKDPAKLDADIALLGVPCSTPYTTVGPYCANAPGAIRAAIAAYSSNVHHFDFDLGGTLFPNNDITAADCGDLEYDEHDFQKNRQSIRYAITKILDRNAVPIVMGGDDSIPIPVFEAFAGRGEFTVLQIDAHIDWRDEVNGEQWGLSSTMRRASEMPHIKQIIQVGQRGIGSARPEDYQAALDWGVQFYSARDIYTNGVGPVIQAIPTNANIIMSLDCDGLDPTVIPGVIGRAPGGLTYWQTIELIHNVAQKTKIVAVNVVEFFPEKDIDQLGALTVARIIVNTIGVIARAG